MPVCCGARSGRLTDADRLRECQMTLSDVFWLGFAGGVPAGAFGLVLLVHLLDWWAGFVVRKGVR